MRRTDAVSDDLLRQVLQVAAAASAPLGRFDIADAIDPGRPELQEGTAEHDAFLQQRIAIVAAAAVAERDGLLDCVRPATGGEGDLLRISTTGRERLQQLS